MDANIDLEKVANATVMKDGDSVALAIGKAVIEATANATRFFTGSLGLDITSFVLSRIGEAKDESFEGLLKKKIQSLAYTTPAPAPKRRGRPPMKETDNV